MPEQYEGREDLPLSHQPPYGEEQAMMRQERRRWSVWALALAGLAVVLIVAGSLAIWPQATDPAPTASISRTDPINAQPSGPGAFDDNPATGPGRAASDVDRSGTPSGNGGGPTGVNTPSGNTSR